MENFTKHIETLGKLLSEAASDLHDLKLGKHIISLKEAAHNQEFRVSVLGRFKHGKSSVINALLDQPISPADTLPCTSRIIEFKYGKNPCFYRCNSRGVKIKSTIAKFKKDSTINGSYSSPTNFWQILLPVAWLGSSITLVDTPGTDEDKKRLEISENELKRSDAALVVLKADQLGSLEDLELIEDLQLRIGCVIVLVNRIDLISLDQRDRIMAYAANLLKPIGIHQSKILPFSAKKASEKNPEFLEMLKNTHKCISQTLLKDVGGAKLLGLMMRTELLVKEITPLIEGVIHTSQKNLKASEKSNNEAKKNHQDYKSLMENVHKTIQLSGKGTANSASRIFQKQWKLIVHRLKNKKDSWYSVRNPLFSPRAYAIEIGEDAKRSLEKMVEQSVKIHLQPTIEAKVANMQKRIRTDLDELYIIAASVGLGDIEDIERQLLSGVTKDAFGDAIDDAALNATTGAAIIAVVSGIIGYIIADIILFYILGIISGFLNPILLAVAASLGLLTYIFKGKNAVGKWIKRKIAKKLSSKLSSDEVINQLVSSVKDSTIELFKKLSKGYENQISLLIKTTKEKVKATETKRIRHQKKLKRNLRKQKEAQKNLNKIITFLKKEITNLEKERMA
ncbi:dynamin family protein [Desulfococcaceae bacterium HSG9]|nr:dynamin family protein [Desulfococcaceae bacterium HSG9]